MIINKMRENIHKSFTLIELLIVLVVMGILATLIVPTYQTWIDRAEWASQVNMGGAMMRAVLAYNMGTGKWPTDLGASNSAIFKELNFPDPNPSLPPLKKQFRYDFLNGGVDSSGHRLVFMMFRDLDGDGTVSNPTNPQSKNGVDPHMWFYSDGSISARSGAPTGFGK